MDSIYSFSKFKCLTFYVKHPENGRQNVECGFNEINTSLIIAYIGEETIFLIKRQPPLPLSPNTYINFIRLYYRHYEGLCIVSLKYVEKTYKDFLEGVGLGRIQRGEKKFHMFF